MRTEGNYDNAPGEIVATAKTTQHAGYLGRTFHRSERKQNNEHRTNTWLKCAVVAWERHQSTVWHHKGPIYRTFFLLVSTDFVKVWASERSEGSTFLRPEVHWQGGDGLHVKYFLLSNLTFFLSFHFFAVVCTSSASVHRNKFVRVCVFD